MVVFDAQVGAFADKDAQQPPGESDLVPIQTESLPSKTVIDTSSSDPSSTTKIVIDASSSIPSPATQTEIDVASSDPVSNSKIVIVKTLSDPSLICMQVIDEASSDPYATSKTVIDAPSSDPSSLSIALPIEQLQINSVGEAQRIAGGDALVSVQEVPEAGKSLQLANAEAKIPSPSLQLAIESLEAQPDATASQPSREEDQQTKLASTSEENVKHGLNKSVNQERETSDTWCDRAKGLGKRLSRKGEAFTLPSGEACIQIPNSVFEKNRKSWQPFVMGQFYSDPPSQGTLHNIVNGIWSKQYRDIAVTKMEGFSFLFRIPNAATRTWVINQRLWQIECQTMFVDKWEPGVVPVKPELTSAPIWLELRKVPFQFFNEEGLERIAGLVGHPKFLHPTTNNKTNLEVSKVFTIIDPCTPLPEAVNVQFESGDICRVLVLSPWMPPVCDICKEIGHAARRCPSVPKVCSQCNSKTHVL